MLEKSENQNTSKNHKEVDESKQNKHKDLPHIHKSTAAKSESIKRFNFLLIAGLLSVTIGTIGVITTSKTNREGVPYVQKQILKTSLITSIGNGADLGTIKNTFENRVTRRKSIYHLFSDEHEYYLYDTPLSKVLRDIRSDIYEKDTTKMNLLDLLNRLILEHQELNPFDALEPNQKDNFENIRLKSGEHYDIIQTETNKLAKELETKNALVNKYLNRSNTSFWISILACIISFCFGLIQLYFNRSSNVEKSVRLVLRESNKSTTPDLA